MLFGKEEKSYIDEFVNIGKRFAKAQEEKVVSSPSSSNEENKLTVETIHNHVYFYADVDSDRVLALIREIRSIDDQLRNERLSRMIPKDIPMTPIWLHIQSGGGDLFAGLSAADQLDMIETPIYSIVEGYVASAATLISLSCKKRYILPNAFMLIHEFSTGLWGKHREFRDEMYLQEMLMSELVDFYSKKTSLKKKKVRKLLDHDSWFSAKQCVEYELCDGIMRKE